MWPTLSHACRVQRIRLWQLAMASAFGLLGVFVATPLLALLHTTLEFFYVERRLGKARES